MPSRSYNMTVNHRRRILGTTKGHPARWNDKTLQLHDSFLKQLWDGNILEDVCFKLLEYPDDNWKGVRVEATYKGAWLLVDKGGYILLCLQGWRT